MIWLKKFLKENWIFILIIFLITLLLISVACSAPMGNDEGIWNYISRLWVKENLPPYVGGLENKTPGIFLLFGFSNFLFGVNFWFPRLLGIISLIIATVFVYKIGKELHSKTAGIFGMLIFGLTMTWPFVDGTYIAQTESFMILFTILAFHTLIKMPQRFFLIGLFLGLAISFKQVAIFDALAIFFIINFFRKARLKDNIFLLLGIICATFLALLPLLLSGTHLSDYFYGAWRLLLYGDHFSLNERVRLFIKIWSGPEARLLLFLPLLFIVVAQKRDYFWPLFVWAVFCFLGVNLSGNYYGHQFKQLVPPIALMSGIFIADLIGRPKLISFAAAVVFLLWLPVDMLKFDFVMPNKLADSRRDLGLLLNKETIKGDYVYIYGRGGNPVMAYSDRKSSSRYFNSFFINNGAEKKELLNDLVKNQPKYILLPQNEESHSFYELDQIIRQSYSLQMEQGNYQIYKVKT